MSAVAWYADTAVVAGLYGLGAGWFVPQLIARIPEPDPAEPAVETEAAPSRLSEPPPADTAEPSPADTSEPSPVNTSEPPPADTSEPPPAEGSPPKERYDAIAALPGLRWKTALATGLVAGLVGGRVGWGFELTFLLYLAPVGVALAVVDWRTRLLPTKLIAPSYVVVGLLAVAASWIADDWAALLRSGLGWALAGGTFFVLWFVYPKGMGYGDVRLSGVLGLALGWLGWAELLTGVYAGFLLGGVGGILLSALRVVDRRAYPFGPFMLVGAVVGILFGPYVADWYA